MKFKLDNIIYMTLKDAETGQPIWADDESAKSVELEFDEIENPKEKYLIAKPNVGDPISLEMTLKGGQTIMNVEGFYGGLADE